MTQDRALVQFPLCHLPVSVITEIWRKTPASFIRLHHRTCYGASSGRVLKRDTARSPTAIVPSGPDTPNEMART